MPIATIALTGLSALRVEWRRLGILRDPTEPSSPQQNGRHERMHRTLTAVATALFAATPGSGVSPHWKGRRVSRNRRIRWGDAWVNVSHVLAVDSVAFAEVAGGV